jgi:hypothetical protein
VPHPPRELTGSVAQRPAKLTLGAAPVVFAVRLTRQCSQHAWYSTRSCCGRMRVTAAALALRLR